MGKQTVEEERRAKLGRLLGEQVFSTDEIADLLGVAETTVRDWIKRGELLASKIGKFHFVTAESLKATMREREQQQLDDAARSRRERLRLAQRDRELEERRRREPTLGWELTDCVQCGLDSVVASRNMRLGGDVLCGQCRDWVAQHGLSRDGWDRKVRLYAKEQAALDWSRAWERGHEDISLGAMQAPAYGGEDWRDWPVLPRNWLVYHCIICGKPRAVSTHELADPYFYPACDHSAPYAGHSRDETEGRDDSKVIADFSRVEARARSRPSWVRPDQFETMEVEEVPDWQVAPCAVCGLRQAVARIDDRLIGRTKCRACSRAGAERSAGLPLGPAPVLDILKELDEKRRYTAAPCACGRWELFDTTDGRELILSWCKDRPREERVALAEEYAEGRIFDPDARAFLLERAGS